MLKPIVKIINLGRMNYVDALKIQFKYQNKLIESVNSKRNIENFMIIVEHEPVYTVGKLNDKSMIIYDCAGLSMINHVYK